MLPALSPQEFVAKWRKTTLKERSAAQEHFIDLCRLVGHPTPAEADPSGQTFAFEVGATKQRGGEGWADVWKKGCFAWEYKGKHKTQLFFLARQDIIVLHRWRHLLAFQVV